jgi:hypothetical protein
VEAGHSWFLRKERVGPLSDHLANGAAPKDRPGGVEGQQGGRPGLPLDKRQIAASILQNGRSASLR